MLMQVRDACRRRHNNGSVVLLITQASENQDGATAVEDLVQFATVLEPVLREYLP